jgi:hypothetical protein
MTEPRKGPLESRAWPTQLEAFAVTPGSEPRLMGYDVEGDLARAHRFSDLLFLAVAGELPEPPVSRAFEIALVFLLPLSVAHAPVHAAALSRICGARTSGVLSVASLSLAEDASEIFLRCRAVLEQPMTTLGSEHGSSSAEETASVTRLTTLLDGVLDVPLLAQGPGRTLALLAVLWACGLRTEEQVVAVLTMARLPSAVAEAAPRTPLGFGRYPTLTPPIEYEP